MHKVLAILVCSVILSSCSDENTGNNPDNQPVETIVADTSRPAKTIKKNESIIEGLTYNIDSVTYKALVLYNKVTINSICAEIVTNILEKDKKIALQNDIQTLYAFEISKEDIDSLKMYGFTESDMSHTDPKKHIYITGVSPYRERGLWERVRVNSADYEKEFPKLFNRAVSVFFDRKKPVIANVSVTDQASKYVDYSAEFKFSDDQSVYIYFTVKNVNQKIDITLNKGES